MAPEWGMVVFGNVLKSQVIEIRLRACVWTVGKAFPK